MKRPFVLTGVLACFVAGALSLFNLKAEVVEGLARFDRDMIFLPAVVAGEAQYEMDLQSLSPSDSRSRRRDDGVPVVGSTFRVVRSIKGLDSSAGPAAIWKNDLLRIPRIQWGGVSYRLEMRAVAGNPELFTLSSAAALNAPEQGYAVLPDGRGGFNYEAAVTPNGAGFDKARSLAAFQETLYPFLKSKICTNCHSSRNLNGSGAQAPMHTDWDPAVAHEYALTRVNFADPANSKFVVRMRLDKHNCPNSNCAAAAADMLQAINDWKSRIADMLPQAPRLVAADVKIAEPEVEQWIATDRALLAPQDRDFIVYTSMHELHNEGLSADELNVVRTGLSKALNSVSRWAPRIVNPVDVNGLGLLYKFDMRDYWGWNKGVIRLLFGGSDDDLAFGRNKRDYRGNPVDSAVQRERYNYAANVTWDPEFSKTIWERVLHGNVEGNTLVVVTADQNEKTWFDRAGNFHSDDLKVTERFTLIDSSHIRYEATMDDPRTFSRPWTIAMILYRNIDENAQILENKCVPFADKLLYSDLMGLTPPKPAAAK